MRTVKFDFNGQEFHLCMNGEALFSIYEKFGTKGFVTDPIQGTSKKSFDATCWMLSKLSEQGELVRRNMGFDRKPIRNEGYFRAMLGPLDVADAKRAIADTVRVGFTREVPDDDENEEIDLVLLERERENGTNLSRAKWLQLTTQFLNLSVKDALLMTCGEVGDLITLEKTRRGMKEETE